MKRHKLKTWRFYYEDVLSGKKRWELRKNDRDFKVGDILILQEFDNVNEKYTGRELSTPVVYLLENGEHFGLKEGFCIIGTGEIHVTND